MVCCFKVVERFQVLSIKYRPMSSSKMLVRNLMIYGVGGIITPFVGIKIIDLIISPLLEMIGFIGF